MHDVAAAQTLRLAYGGESFNMVVRGDFAAANSDYGRLCAAAAERDWSVRKCRCVWRCLEEAWGVHRHPEERVEVNASCADIH